MHYPLLYVAVIGMGGIGFDVALYLLERGSRATLGPVAFAEHWGISPEGKIGSPAAAEPHYRITMLEHSHTPFGHTLGRTTGWGQTPSPSSFHLIGGAREATELDAKRAMLEGAELAARL